MASKLSECGHMVHGGRAHDKSIEDSQEVAAPQPLPWIDDSKPSGQQQKLR